MARLAVALVYAAPLILLVTLPLLGLPLHRWLDPRVTAWLHLALATPVVFWCGLPNLERGLAAARRRPFSREPLIAGATIMAFLSGASASAAPWLLPDGLRYQYDLAAAGCGLATALVIVCLAAEALRTRTPGTVLVIRTPYRSG
jgi:Cu+-exporting ATPase